LFDFNIDENYSLEYMHKMNASDLFEFIDSNREELSEFLSWVHLIQTKYDEQKYIDLLKSNKTSISFIILFEGKIIGTNGFLCIDDINKNAQIGYCMDKNFKGKGINTKATKKIIEFGFSELDLQRIEFRIASKNIKSKAVANRLSAKFEGTLRKSYLLHNEFVDLEVYSILKNEYKT